ncbi:MAG TPA: TRAP transporter substrate-binding protein [Magnetospirillum sp.]|jgi:C4-dicarboxylate-binding protein DctP|nr:TRAP transporter substrate-binding protein [Magnetospirillum sp.]
MPNFRFAAGCLLAALLGAAPALASESLPIIIKFSHVAAVDTPKGQAAELFKKLAEERTKGRVKVEVYPNSQLYKDKEELEALQMGAVQMLAPGVTKFGPLGIKEFEAFDLPFLFDDYDAVRPVTQGPIGRGLLKKMESKGLVGLAYWDNGFKLLTSNKPFNKVENFRGQKLRIHSSKVVDAQMRAWGAMPQVMAFSEVYPALQTGVIDGQENPAENILTQKFYEVQKYLTVSNHAYMAYAVVTNKKFWDGLPPDIRAILEGAMDETTAYETAITKSRNDTALAKIRAMSTITVVDLTPEERDALRKAVEPVYRDAEGRVGKEIVEAIRKTAQH